MTTLLLPKPYKGGMSKTCVRFLNPLNVEPSDDILSG